MLRRLVAATAAVLTATAIPTLAAVPVAKGTYETGVKYVGAPGQSSELNGVWSYALDLTPSKAGVVGLSAFRKGIGARKGSTVTRVRLFMGLNCLDSTAANLGSDSFDAKQRLLERYRPEARWEPAVGFGAAVFRQVCGSTTPATSTVTQEGSRARPFTPGVLVTMKFWTARATGWGFSASWRETPAPAGQQWFLVRLALGRVEGADPLAPLSASVSAVLSDGQQVARATGLADNAEFMQIPPGAFAAVDYAFAVPASLTVPPLVVFTAEGASVYLAVA